MIACLLFSYFVPNTGRGGGHVRLIGNKNDLDHHSMLTFIDQSDPLVTVKLDNLWAQSILGLISHNADPYQWNFIQCTQLREHI